MPSLIINHFEPLCAFLMPLIVSLSAPQQRHALNVVGALLVSSAKHKCLTTLTGLLRVPHADHFALADFFRRSGWCPLEVQRAVLTAQMAVLVRVLSISRNACVFLSIDDSLACKDVATRALEAVTLHHDHVTQRAQVRSKSQTYTNAARFITVSLCVNGLSFPVTWRLYLTHKQVKRLNRARPEEQRLKYVKLTDLAVEMLDEIAPHLPSSARVYVLFDSWYSSADLMNDILSRGWDFICGVKSNRNLSGSPMSAYWRILSHQRIRHVRLKSTKGSQTNYTRYTTGRLRGIPQPVVAVFSKRDPHRPHLAYFVSSDVRLRAQTLLRYYAFRWQCETDNFLLKERLGLADFRLHSVEAVQRWFCLVFAAYAFVRVRIAQTWLSAPDQPVPTFHDVITEQQRWHLEHLVVFVADQARSGWSNERIIAHLQPT